MVSGWAGGDWLGEACWFWASMACAWAGNGALTPNEVGRDCLPLCTRKGRLELCIASGWF